MDIILTFESLTCRAAVAGSDIRFSNYADDEPRDVDSRCLYADGSDGGLWKTGECGARRAYVCGIGGETGMKVGRRGSAGDGGRTSAG